MIQKKIDKISAKYPCIRASKKVLGRFWDFVERDEGDFCCVDVKFFYADPDRGLAFYACPMCGDVWVVEFLEIVYGPPQEPDPDKFYEQYKDKRG